MGLDLAQSLTEGPSAELDYLYSRIAVDYLLYSFDCTARCKNFLGVFTPT